MLLTLVLTAFILAPATGVKATYRFETDIRTSEFYTNNVRHMYIEGMLNYNGDSTKQRINYFSANPLVHDDIHVVVADNYLDYSWGNGTPFVLKDNIHERYDNLEVLGGVNGDFYDTSNGMPIGAFIKDFRVLHNGIASRHIVGFKDSGETIIGVPEFAGHELVIFDRDGDIRNKINIDGINQMPANDEAITAYFADSETTLPDDVYKMIISADLTKIDEGGRSHYGEGALYKTTEAAFDTDMIYVVLVGEPLKDIDYIHEDDTLVVQRQIVGDFEGVRFALGGNQMLVENGEPTDYWHSRPFRHPRTAVGVKEDGTVFFLAVDGRDYPEFVPGIRLSELGELMAELGAVTALNLDGGGSTGMIIRNHDLEYDYVNYPSDGRVRPVTNGAFFVQGSLDNAPVHLPFPDERETLSSPQNIFIDGRNIVFDDVAHASAYEIIVNGQTYRSLTPMLDVDLETGLNNISVRAIGDYEDYKNSDFTEDITYTVYNEPVKDVLNRLKDMARNLLSE